MTIKICEIVRRYRYLGIELPAPRDMTVEQVRDLHSILYPELVSADIELGEVVGGVQEVTFKRAVGTKGGRLWRLRRAVEVRIDVADSQSGFGLIVTQGEVASCSIVWDQCARTASPNLERGSERAPARVRPDWRQLPPVV